MSYVPGVIYGAWIILFSWLLPWLFPVSMPRSDYCVAGAISTSAWLFHSFFFSFKKLKPKDELPFLLRSIQNFNNSDRFVFLVVIFLHIVGIVMGVATLLQFQSALNIWIVVVMPTGVSIGSFLLFLFGNPHDIPLTRD